MSTIYSAIKDFFSMVSDFFGSIGELFVYIWDFICQIDDMLLLVGKAAAQLPSVLTFIPPEIMIFATSLIAITVLYFIIGRLKG